MQLIIPHDPFPFLSSSRIHALQSGVRSFNDDDLAVRQDRMHLYRHMNSWHRGIWQRPLLIGHITEALSDDDYAEVYVIGNMQGILFDRQHFCRFFKLHTVLHEDCIGSRRIGREPVTFRNARELPAERLLFSEDALDDGLIPSLAYLTRNDIGYYMRRREVVELYVLHQDGHTLHNMRQLSMMDGDYPSAVTVSA